MDIEGAQLALVYKAITFISMFRVQYSREAVLNKMS